MSLTPFRREWPSVLACVLSLLTAFIYRPYLPQKVPSLFNGLKGTLSYPGAGDFNAPGWAAFFPVFVITSLSLIFLLSRGDEESDRTVMSLWRKRPWVRGAVLLLLWYSQFLTLDQAASPQANLWRVHASGAAGMLFLLVGLVLAERSSAGVRHAGLGLLIAGGGLLIENLFRAVGTLLVRSAFLSPF